MSLINQMLRDLQQQKNGGELKKSQTLHPGKRTRIPYLPLPLVLGGAAVVLLFFIWWLAGALSDMRFGFEPVESQPVVVTEGLQTAESAEQDQLTMAERDAEPPSVAVASEQVVNKRQAPVNVLPVKTTSVVKVPAKKISIKKQAVVKQVVAKPASAVTKQSKSTFVRRKPEVVSLRVTQKTQRVKSHQAQVSPKLVTSQSKVVTQPGKIVTKGPKRLHPDALPGAILSSGHSLTATKGPSRLSAVHATTPYGMAEEAFLDGKWALDQQRDNLAVSSLQHALELYPGHLPARELLTEILEKDGKTGEAMFLLAEGLEIAPDYIVFKKSYARLLVEQGDYEAAIKVMLHEGLPTVEDDPEAHVVMATLYQHLGESFLAAQTYRNLLAVWPQTGAFWVGLGGALEGQNLFEEAVECYQRALNTKNLRQDLSRYAKKRLDQLD